MNYFINKQGKRHLPFDIVNAGLHCDLNISKQILPLLLILGWYILVVNAICTD